jgi:hypothetical protein
MDLTKVLEELRKELQHLDAAIQSLQRLQEKAARRGRPPKALRELRRSANFNERRPATPRRRIQGNRPES